jgi:hypothetical protein
MNNMKVDIIKHKNYNKLTYYLILIKVPFVPYKFENNNYFS